MIVQLANAVSDDDCRRLTQLYDRQAQLTAATEDTGHPVLYWSQFRNAVGAEIVPPMVDACLCAIYRLQPPEPLYPETVILAALGAGGYHSRHADNCRESDQGVWVPNHTPQRDVTAIYYLNNEFDGGEIVFGSRQLVVKPHRGLLLAFPSDADHVHEVLPVRSGVRYTMPIWFTKQQRYALADFSVDATAIGTEVRTPA